MVKNKRKISLNQAFKKTSQENAKKENNNLIENSTNIKINFAEPKKLVDVKINSNNDEENEEENDEGENTNNINVGESTMNKKEDEEGDEEAEGEEYEGEENEDDNDNNDESMEGKNPENKNNNDKLNFIHEDDINDEEDCDA